MATPIDPRTLPSCAVFMADDDTSMTFNSTVADKVNIWRPSTSSLEPFTYDSGTSSTGPYWGRSTFNGKKVLTMNGGSAFVTSIAIVGQQYKHCMWLVCSLDNDTVSNQLQGILGNSSSGYKIYANANKTLSVGTITNVGSYTANVPFVLTVQSSTTSGTADGIIYKNNVALNAGVAFSLASAARMTLFANHTNVLGAAGKVMAVVWWFGTLDDMTGAITKPTVAEREGITQWLLDYWGIGLAPHKIVHSVTDIAQIANESCIYYNQTPAIVVGNKISHPVHTETNKWSVRLDALGRPIINSAGQSGSDSFKFNIERSEVWDPVPPASNVWSFAIADAPIITTTTLNTMTYGSVFSQTLAATGATPITWSVTTGTLPAGLTLAPTTGVLSGTPTTVGAYSFTVTATNADGNDTQAYSGNVLAVIPDITTTSLPNGTVGSPYSFQLAATGSPTITWTVTGGSLPTGITLSLAGLLSGTPTTPGTSSPQFTATNTGGTDVSTLSLTIVAASVAGEGKGLDLGLKLRI